MSKFKLGLTIVFSVFIIIGIAVFAASKGTNSGPVSNVTVWGYVSPDVFDAVVKSSNLSTNKTITVNYVQKTQANFESDFINALANAAGPDVVMLSSDQIYQNENKLYPIPYTTYSERTFKDNFVQEGEVFLLPTTRDSSGATVPGSVLAVPFIIDPLVMYWNRDIFNAAALAQPPKYWDEILTLPLKLTTSDTSKNVTQSAVALGEWSNVLNSKAILSNLFIQAGTPIVDQTYALPRSALENTSAGNGPGSGGQVISPAEASLNFYTQFANPTSQTYSWNRSLPDSLTSFLSGKLALYFGFASELATIRAKNPNLNFDVTAMPQPRQSASPAVFGRIYGLALVKQSKSISAGFTVVTQLTSSASLTTLATVTNLPPVRRALLTTLPDDPYKTVFYKSALIAKGWLDPDPQSTDMIWKNMIESVTSGRARTTDAIRTAHDQLNTLFGQ